MSWQSSSTDPANGEKSVVMVRIIESCWLDGFFALPFVVDFFVGSGPIRGVLTKRIKFIVRYVLWSWHSGFF